MTYTINDSLEKNIKQILNPKDVFMTVLVEILRTYETDSFYFHKNVWHEAFYEAAMKYPENMVRFDTTESNGTHTVSNLEESLDWILMLKELSRIDSDKYRITHPEKMKSFFKNSKTYEQSSEIAEYICGILDKNEQIKTKKNN